MKLRIITIMLSCIMVLCFTDQIICKNNLSSSQLHVRNTAKEIGSKSCVQGMCFGKTLTSIAFTESTYRVGLVGDKKTGKPLYKCSLGPFQIKVSTAKEVIEKAKLEDYYYLLDKKGSLVSKLLYDVDFGAVIASNYLKLNYITALKRGVSNPWRFAVSRYNGGNNNITYINKIASKIK